VESPAKDLIEAVDRVIPGWIERLVEDTARQRGHPVDRELIEAARAAGERARAAVADELGRLLGLDVDEQRSNPLTVLRSAAGHATDVLRTAGVPQPSRDDFARRAFPDDVYGLAPATWADVDPSLTEPGIVWGAWKAATVLDRRRREGRR
jgi:hypothetical protein